MHKTTKVILFTSSIVFAFFGAVTVSAQQYCAMDLSWDGVKCTPRVASTSAGVMTINEAILNPYQSELIIYGKGLSQVSSTSYVVSGNNINTVLSGDAPDFLKTDTVLKIRASAFSLSQVSYFKIILKNTVGREVSYSYFSPENKAITNPLKVTLNSAGGPLYPGQTYSFSWTNGREGDTYNVYLTNGVSPLGSPANAMLVQVGGISGSESFRVDPTLDGNNYRIKFVKVTKNERLYADSIDPESSPFSIGVIMGSTSSSLISLSSSNCIIPAMGNQCGSLITWNLNASNVSNFIPGRSTFTVSGVGGYTISNDSYTSTTFMNPKGENTVTYTLSHNGTLLDTKTVTSKCAVGTRWDGDKCFGTRLPPIITNQPLIFEAKQNSVRIRGIVQSAEGGSYTVRTIGGTWKVRIVTNTRFISSTSENAQKQQISVGDYVGMTGNIIDDADFTADALTVRNRTLFP
jgi:hypothetical protein